MLFLLRRLFLFLLIATSLGTRAVCAQLPTTDPLEFSLKDATIIVAAQIVDYPKSPALLHKGPTFSEDNMTIAEAGTYHFRALQYLRGVGKPDFQVDLPAVKTPYYDRTSFSLQEKDTVLLFLRKGKEGKVEAVSSYPSLIRIANEDAAEQQPSRTNETVEGKIVGLLLHSLENDSLRPSSAYHLQQFVDPRVPGAVLPYIDDKNLVVQDSVLSCLAFNQQAQAIPQIIKLNDTLLAKGRGATSVQTLQFFKTSKAVSALNTALSNHNYTVRMFAGWGLRNIKSRESIPYFVLALHDPNEMAAANAYMGLHEIVPSIGPRKDLSYFDAHRQAETEKIMAWWRDELNGKHSSRNIIKAP